MEYKIDPYKLQVMPDGQLDRGYYHYRVVAITNDKEIDLVNTLRVFAPYAGSSIGIFWDEVPGAVAYRIHRRTGNDKEKSIITPCPAYFYDTGVIEFE